MARGHSSFGGPRVDASDLLGIFVPRSRPSAIAPRHPLQGIEQTKWTRLGRRSLQRLADNLKTSLNGAKG